MLLILLRCMNMERRKGKHNTTQFLSETKKLIYGREIVPYEETQIKCKMNEGYFPRSGLLSHLLFSFFTSSFFLSCFNSSAFSAVDLTGFGAKFKSAISFFDIFGYFTD